MRKALVILVLVFSWSVAAKDSPVKLPSPDVTSDDYRRLKSASEKKNGRELVKAISIILSKDSENLRALNRLGVYHFNKNEAGLARIIFERGLKAHGKSPALHNNLGVVALKEGKLRKAILSFKKAISLKSGHRQAATNISAIYLEYGHSKKAVGPLEDAYDDIRQDLSRGSLGAAQIASNYAVALAGVGKGGRAKGIYENIMNGKSRNVNVMLNHAILLVRVLKERKSAIRLLTKIKFISEDRRVLKRVAELEKELDNNG